MTLVPHQGGSSFGPVSRTLIVVSLAWAGASCDERVQAGFLEPVTAPLGEVFTLVSEIQLAEDPADSIAEVGAFLQRRNGGFVIGDRLLPRVRSYGENGRLEAAVGRFGEGPFEFTRISAVAETVSDRIVVAGGQNRLTYFSRDLSPDTVVTVSGFVADAMALGPDLILGMLAPESLGRNRRTASAPLIHRLSGHSLAWSAYPLPFTQVERPYWPSLATVPMAVAGDSVFVAVSLLYPVSILSGDGQVVNAIGTPPPSFQQVSVLEAGALSDASASGQMPEFLASFQVIDRIDVVADSYLVLTHGQFDRSRQGLSGGRLHTSLDIYNRHTGAKLYEDIPLPRGSKVLGGGRYLYLLLNKDFPPWRIAKLQPMAGD